MLKFNRAPSLQRALFFAAGWLFVVIGVIGIFLPLLPTTPFLLLAAWCFSKSSERFHAWLLDHPRLGPPVKDWQRYGVIRLWAKWLATAMMGVAILFPMVLIKVPVWAKIVTVITTTCVLTFIWTRPSSPTERPEQRAPG